MVDLHKYRQRLDLAREFLAFTVERFLSGSATRAELKRASQKEARAEHAFIEASRGDE